MIYVWIVLAVLSAIVGMNAIRVSTGAYRVPEGQARLSKLIATLIAVVVLAALFVVAYGEERVWMVIGSYVVLGLLAPYALFMRWAHPPPGPIHPDELIRQIEDYTNRPGQHAISLTVQEDMVNPMLHGRLARYRLTDQSCLFCFVEQRLVALLDQERGLLAGTEQRPNDGGAIAREYRGRLRNGGPSVEVHMRRPSAAEPWHIWFAGPSVQPSWESGYLTRTCRDHRPTDA